MEPLITAAETELAEAERGTRAESGQAQFRSCPAVRRGRRPESE